MTDDALAQQAHEWRKREVQAIGAAISTRSWHAVEQAYNSLRDKMDRAGCWHAPTPALSIVSGSDERARLLMLTGEIMQRHPKLSHGEARDIADLALVKLGLTVRGCMSADPALAVPALAASRPTDAGAGEVHGKWHEMLLSLVNTLHRDGGEKTQAIGIRASYEQAIALATPKPPVDEAMREAAQSLLNKRWASSHGEWGATDWIETDEPRRFAETVLSNLTGDGAGA